MTRRSQVVLGLAAVALLAGIRVVPLRSSVDTPSRFSSGIVLPSPPEDLSAILESLAAHPASGEDTFTGGIVPHHLLASDLIADFFAHVDVAQVQRVILIAPNHDEIGLPILTSAASWDTPLGVVPGDTDGVSQLVRATRAVRADDVVQHEHGITNILPYIAARLPGARVVPVILKRSVSLGDIHALSDVLATLTDTHTLVIVSVDFSHGLTAHRARDIDARTQPALIALDEAYFASLGTNFSETADTPLGLVTLFRVLHASGRTNARILTNTDGAVLTGAGADAIVTSYFEVGFR